jgi:hypothetical protein
MIVSGVSASYTAAPENSYRVGDNYNNHNYQNNTQGIFYHIIIK